MFPRIDGPVASRQKEESSLTQPPETVAQQGKGAAARQCRVGGEGTRTVQVHGSLHCGNEVRPKPPPAPPGVFAEKVNMRRTSHSPLDRNISRRRTSHSPSIGIYRTDGPVTAPR
eukprot:1184201-Prorocentrum_minimum.AAC.5